MRTSINCVDVVGKAEHRLRVGIVVLQANLHDHAASLGFHVDGLFVKHLLAAVQMLDKFGDTAVVFELGGFRFAGLGIGSAFIGERDQQALVQERQLTQALGQRVEVVFSGGKDASIRQEVNFGAKLLAGARFLQLAGGIPFGISLLPGKSIAPDFEIEFFAQGVNAGNADTVQASGNFIGRRVELAAGMQLSEHHLCGGNLFAVNVHHVDGNTAAVVDHGNRVVEMNGYFNGVAIAGERFVDRVVDNFVNQMVQANLAGRTDVHRGTFAHGFHPAEDFDRVGVVVSVAPVYGRKLCGFWLSFVDGSDFFRSHSAPWKGPGVGLSRRPFPIP